MALSRTRKWILIAALVLAPAALLTYRTTGWAQYGGSIEPVSLDLEQPDVRITTRSLSSLPRDLLRIPIARDLLTEDFVFYYQEHPDRLSLAGTIRRLAYEHDLRWTDELIAWVLDQPAEVRLWRGPKGALDYWAISIERREVAKVLQEAATIALKDRQLTHAATLHVDGEDVEALALAYAPQRTFVIASRGDRVLILSHAGLVLGEEGLPVAAREEIVGRWLSETPAVTADHSVVVRMHYLSFGYQRFFPGIEALRFDFGGDQWSTQALLDGGALPADGLRDHEIWAGVPAKPALCALLPVDWAQGAPLLEEAPPANGRALADLTHELAGPAAICWYQEGRLHTPLVVATLKAAPKADLTPLFDALFDWSIAKPEEAKPVQAKRVAPDEMQWVRRVEVPYASVDDDGSFEEGALAVTLASKGRYLFFSPEAKLVQQALATVKKRYPSLGDTLPDKATTLAVLVPPAVGAIGKKEALFLLPRANEPVFRTAAEQHLLPRLAAIAKYPAYRLTLASAAPTTRGWAPVTWQELAR